MLAESAAGMSRKPRSNDAETILAAVNRRPEGVAIGALLEPGATPAQRKAMLRRLKQLVGDKKIEVRGERKATRYFPLEKSAQQTPTPQDAANDTAISLSPAAEKIRKSVHRPIQRRNPVGYDRAFLESYRPNETFYLPASERKKLRAIGQTDLAEQPAGTYAKQIMQRLMIDLAFNSSRLEGNTYSLLDTERLLELGQVAQGRANQETQMILNHKDAIDFLVSDAEEIGFNRHTILNLHALLSNNLLSNPAAFGSLRMIGVGISGSVYKPLEIPSVIDEVFDQILHTASMIEDPFEQAFFALVHIPYLQAFEDVNKRVSRLAANIPLIKGNLRPLSFVDVPNDLHTAGMLAIYELNRIDILKEVFIWAYRRSARQYAAVRQTLGEPDAFRLLYRDRMREIVSEIIRDKLDKAAAVDHLRQWAAAKIPIADREQFARTVETELASLHEGNFVRYRVQPSEFRAWKVAWG